MNTKRYLKVATCAVVIMLICAVNIIWAKSNENNRQSEEKQTEKKESLIPGVNLDGFFNEKVKNLKVAQIQEIGVFRRYTLIDAKIDNDKWEDANWLLVETGVFENREEAKKGIKNILSTAQMPHISGKDVGCDIGDESKVPYYCEKTGYNEKVPIIFRRNNIVLDISSSSSPQRGGTIDKTSGWVAKEIDNFLQQQSIVTTKEGFHGHKPKIEIIQGLEYSIQTKESITITLRTQAKSEVSLIATITPSFGYILQPEILETTYNMRFKGEIDFNFTGKRAGLYLIKYQVMDDKGMVSEPRELRIVVNKKDGKDEIDEEDEGKDEEYYKEERDKKNDNPKDSSDKSGKDDTDHSGDKPSGQDPSDNSGQGKPPDKK